MIKNELFQLISRNKLIYLLNTYFLCDFSIFQNAWAVMFGHSFLYRNRSIRLTDKCFIVLNIPFHLNFSDILFGVNKIICIFAM